MGLHVENEDVIQVSKQLEDLQMKRIVDTWSDSAAPNSAEVSALISSRSNWEVIGAGAVCC